MSLKKDQSKKDCFLLRMLPVLQIKAVQGSNKGVYGSVLMQSAKEFTELLHDLEHSGLDMRKIHAFNANVAGLGDDRDLTPEEMLCALELLAKYIVLHANLSGGERVNRIISLLGFDPEKIARVER